MNNAPAILRSLAIYAICVPLAVFVGYMLTDPMDYTTFAYAGILGMLLVFPLLLRWHYALLVFSFNASIYLFFLKGKPDMWVVMTALSLGISLAERAMNSQKHFLGVPQMNWPLICLLGVIFMTAKLTGGIGMRAFGSDVYGGRKYLWLIIGVLTYFALTARRIPPEQAGWYFALYMLSGLTAFIGDLYPFTPSFLHFIFWLFPPSLTESSIGTGMTRFHGIANAAGALLFWYIGTNGLRGMFLSRKIWRTVMFFVLSIVCLLGGHRIILLSYLFLVTSLFFLEKLYRTRVLLLFAFVGVSVVTAIIPLAPYLPFSIQRSLSILPLNVSWEARQDAEGSSEWRIKMWKDLLPQIPSYLLLGKGYAITMEDTELMGQDTAFHSVDAGEQGLAVSGDYHNGPLSVVLPFGIWGVIVVLWLMIAGMRVMYNNYRYGDEALRNINTYLWAFYLYVVLRFIFVFGALSGDIVTFAGTVGFSIALNGGMCRPVLKPVQARQPILHPARISPRPRPVFQR
jgi:hypothetical protein